MKIARIIIASLFAVGSLLAGGALAQHSAPTTSHKMVIADPILCCDAARI